MLSGVPVREHGRSMRPPLSENTNQKALLWEQRHANQGLQPSPTGRLAAGLTVLPNFYKGNRERRKQEVRPR